MNASAPLDADARHRLLALMGVDVYVSRAKVRVKGSGSFTESSVSLPCCRATVNEPDPFTDEVALVIVLDPGETGPEPLSGRYGALLRQILAAAGIAPAAVRFVDACEPDGPPCLDFGTVKLAAHANALRTVPLEQLRASGEAKRALWRLLRPLRRTLAVR